MKIKVVVLYDVRGWAWWHRARNIKKFIHKDIRVDLAKYTDKVDYEDYDLIILFECSLVHFVPEQYRGKVVLGTSTTIASYLEDLIESLKEHGCIAGLVNNITAYEMVKENGLFYCCENGVDETFFYPCLHPRDPVIACWIGNAESVGNKGLDLIQTACVQTNVKLIYKNVNARDGDTSNIISHDQIRDNFYHKASFYICASETEGTPNTALESLSCGLPVVTTRVGNMPQVICSGINGYFAERSVKGVVKGIERLLGSDIKTLSRNARESILNGWTWQEKVKNYERMIVELMEQNQNFRQRKTGKR